ncbi:MAG: hypothetical protein CMJ55_08295 [Planctomycetaceae bacterium]|nr:hypothetical protein [Planctomycetaceae bacterium]
MSPTDLLLIVLIVLVLLLGYLYYTKTKRKPVAKILQNVSPLAVQLPKRPLEIFIDPDVGSRAQVMELGSVAELEEAIDKIVESNMADRKAINDEATRLEKRVIQNQELKVQDLKTSSETVIIEKKEELTASQKRMAQILEMQKQKRAQRAMELQKKRAAAYALSREKDRLENEKKLAELKLKRQKAAEEQWQATVMGAAERDNLQMENERLIMEARDKAIQEQLRMENEAAEAEEKARQAAMNAATEEAELQAKLEVEREKFQALQAEYETTRQLEAQKLDEAMKELDALVEEEKARDAKMKEEDERMRAEEKQKLLDANAAAIAELEAAEAEQARLDAEAAEIRTKLEAEMLAAEGEQRRNVEAEEADYDAKVASDQAAIDAAQGESSRTGDAAQQAERQAALNIESSSQRDWDSLTADEKARETAQLAEWDRLGANPTQPLGGYGPSNAALHAANMGAIPSAMDPDEYQRCLDAANGLNYKFGGWQDKLSEAYPAVYWYNVAGWKKKTYLDGHQDPNGRSKYKDHYYSMKGKLEGVKSAFAAMTDICALPDHRELDDAGNWNYLQEAIDVEDAIKDAIYAHNQRVAEEHRRQQEAAAAAAAAANRPAPAPSPPPRARTS